MCGINGFTFRDEALLDNMSQATKHRGPDDCGAWFADNVSLGHNRLSIIDLSSAGHQPMVSTTGQLAITYNGELYNFQELKQELAGLYDFRTKTDTEVILAAYQIWGHECLNKFNGMFAFAIWDKGRQELFLARDQMGIKPIYYYWDGARFIFSSEIKGILCHPIERELNREAVNIFFRLLYVPEPMTPWENIYKLPVAHYAVVRRRELTVKRYWQIKSFDTLKDKSQIKEQIRQTFVQAVNRQLISDRPLGLYLSGGIDSTALLGAMSAVSPHPVRTFSVGFDIREQWDKYNSDFNLAKRSSQFFGSQHHEILIGPQHIKDNFEKVIWHADDLVVNHTQPTMYALAAMAKKNVDVFLTGDGGDEIFAGYGRYYLNAWLDRIQFIPRVLHQNRISEWLFKELGKVDLYEKVNAKSFIDRWAVFMLQKEAIVSRFLRPDFNNAGITKEIISDKFRPDTGLVLPKDSTKALMYADLVTWLVDDALNRGDRMSMAHGLEARVPFLDADLVVLAMNIPARFNLDSRQQGKRLFREALREYIPGFVYNEPKRGWFSPVAKWLRGDLRIWAEEILSPGYNRAAEEYLDFGVINDIWQKHLQGEKYALNTIWSLLTFQVWYRIFISQGH